MIRQIVYTFCLENVFCKPVFGELSKMHILKLRLKHNYVLSCSHGTQFFQWLLCSEVNQRLVYCFNSSVIYELSMPKVLEQVFLGRGVGGQINLDQIQESYGVWLLKQTDYVVIRYMVALSGHYLSNQRNNVLLNNWGMPGGSKVWDSKPIPLSISTM